MCIYIYIRIIYIRIIYIYKNYIYIYFKEGPTSTFLLSKPDPSPVQVLEDLGLALPGPRVVSDQEDWKSHWAPVRCVENGDVMEI
jgi:hypothetical protein